VPGVSTNAAARILERFELERFGGDAHTPAIGEEQCSVRGDEVRHGPPLPYVSMEPQTAIHGVDHPIAPGAKLANDWLWWRDVSRGLVGDAHT
jgi:hypothetical protein